MLHILGDWNVFSLSSKLLFKQGLLKCIWCRNVMCNYKICHLKYTFPKLETFRGKIPDYTSRQICAILPSKMAFELHGKNTTWQEHKHLKFAKAVLSITLPNTYFRESLGKFEEKRNYEPFIINIVTKLCFPIQMSRDISCKQKVN